MLAATKYVYIRQYASCLIICTLPMLFMWHKYSFATEARILVASTDEKLSLDDYLEYLDDIAGV
jgi:hypothetical protein